MKKFLAILLVAMLVIPTAFILSASAEDWNTFWVTHFDDNTVEGSGVIFTQPYTGAAWWDHFAFAPVEGKAGVYEIKAISRGWSDGAAIPLDIPEGGFVWATNAGNDYPTLNPGDATAINYTSASCNAMHEIEATWEVGDILIFRGLDLTNKTVPTTTADKQWYEDGYVCTAQVKTYAEGDENTLSEGDDSSAVVDDSSAVVDDSSAAGETSSTAPAASSTDTTSVPKTGDDGISMIVFAVIALVAVAGTAIVIKVRK